MRINGAQKTRPRRVFFLQRLLLGTSTTRFAAERFSNVSLRRRIVSPLFGRKSGKGSTSKKGRGTACRAPEKPFRYFQEAKIVWIRPIASSAAFSFVQFSVITRDMALPQTFSV